MSRTRAVVVLAGFAGLTLPLMPLQALFKRTWPYAARTFPHWYHRHVCRLVGVRIEQQGEIVRDRPVLIVANHTSWLDIPVISAVAPVSFIAKKEVGGWPGVSALARLQRTVFVDREKRLAAGDTAREIEERLAAGDNLVLFAEGTSTDGNRLLPFRSSLFAAVKPGRRPNADEQPAPNSPRAVVQTLTLVYKRLHGIPLGRFDRPLTGWYGDMDLPPHALELLGAGPLDVVIRIGAPIALDEFADRKALAGHTEAEIRQSLGRILRPDRVSSDRPARPEPEPEGD